MKLDTYTQRELYATLENLRDKFGITCIASVCACCGEALGCKDGGGQDGMAGISHGLCLTCKDAQMAEIRKMRQTA